jgi:hypothetical protein
MTPIAYVRSLHKSLAYIFNKSAAMSIAFNARAALFLARGYTVTDISKTAVTAIGAVIEIN